MIVSGVPHRANRKSVIIRWAENGKCGHFGMYLAGS